MLKDLNEERMAVRSRQNNSSHHNSQHNMTEIIQRQTYFCPKFPHDSKAKNIVRKSPEPMLPNMTVHLPGKNFDLALTEVEQMPGRENKKIIRRNRRSRIVSEYKE
jgi:hypothetical protein